MEAAVVELNELVEGLKRNVSSLQTEAETEKKLRLSLEERLGTLGDDVDIFWLIVGAVLVFFMQAGFGMLEVGSIGGKHTKNLLIKNMLDLGVAALTWWVLEYGLAFGTESETANVQKLVGYGSFFTRGKERGETIMHTLYSTFLEVVLAFENELGSYDTSLGVNYAGWLFQWSFSGAAATIVSGAVDERISLSAYFILSPLMVSSIYPIVVRWGWDGEGWASAWSSDRDDLLLGCEVIDFAGSGVVHSTGGLAAIIAAIMLGPRIDQLNPQGGTNSLERQSVILQVLGTSILWMGWYGFNGASTLPITGLAHVAAKVMVCTSIAAAGGGLGVASASMVVFHNVDPEQICNGVNAPPVHLANGVWGVLVAALFATKETYSASYYAERAEKCCGWLYGWGTSQLLTNLVFLMALGLWVGSTVYALTWFLKFMGMLRISGPTELIGTHFVAHGGNELPDYAKAMQTRIQALCQAIGLDETGVSTKSPKSAS